MFSENSPLSHGPFQVKHRATQPDDETRDRHGEGADHQAAFKAGQYSSLIRCQKGRLPFGAFIGGDGFTSHSMPANRKCISVLQQK